MLCSVKENEQVVFCTGSVLQSGLVLYDVFASSCVQDAVPVMHDDSTCKPQSVQQC